MSIKSSEYFSYAGLNSSDFGIVNVNMSTGLFEENFISEQSIKEKKINGRMKPYFQGIEKSPLTIEISFAFMDTWDDEKIREIARWIGNQKYYQPLFFSENPNRIFYCLYVGEPVLIHNGLKQGYVNLQFRCDSPYSYSPTYQTEYDLSTNTVDGTVVEFSNNGDIDLLPELFIYKVGNGDVQIYNLSNSNEELKFTSLADNEQVYINNENEIIESDIPGVYRFDNFNDNYLSLPRGVNQLKVLGNCKLTFRYQFKTLQG